MKPHLLRHAVIAPALRLLVSVSGKQAMASHPAEVMLLAIALQESNAEHRWQKPSGPARGFWQFERGGGFVGVLRHRSSGEIAESLLRELDLPPTEEGAWLALPYSELLQAGFARLLLWTDSRPLPMPMPESEDDAWELYRTIWRPGKPHRDRWTVAWRQACDVCGDF